MLHGAVNIICYVLCRFCATPEQMRAHGFRQVGRDFPVFLHPRTGEEYALARTERKSGPGHRGFVVHADPDVDLEEDLRRRDLTINAERMRSNPEAAGSALDCVVAAAPRNDAGAGVMSAP